MSVLERNGQTATIVEYSNGKLARNGYPKKIISPPSPGECCLTHMGRIGEMQGDGQRFYYKRCTRCGFTVREFVLNVDLGRLLAVRAFDRDDESSWLDRIRREAKVEIAA